MKTALELLGHTGSCGPNCCCHGIDETTRLALENVAHQAREEMREMAGRVCEAMVVGGHAWTDEQEAAANTLFATAKNIRALPVKP
jgi:hypothetical protein